MISMVQCTQVIKLLKKIPGLKRKKKKKWNFAINIVKTQVRKQRNICVYINTKPLTSYETKEDNALKFFFITRLWAEASYSYYSIICGPKYSISSMCEFSGTPISSNHLQLSPPSSSFASWFSPSAWTKSVGLIGKTSESATRGGLKEVVFNL